MNSLWKENSNGTLEEPKPLIAKYEGHLCPQKTHFTQENGQFNRPLSRQTRTAFSLIEVLLATAIMAAGMAALMVRSQQASRTALRSSLAAAAVIRCESAFNMAILNRKPDNLRKVENLLSDNQWLIEISSLTSNESAFNTAAQSLTIRATYRVRPDLGQFELSCLLPANSL